MIIGTINGGSTSHLFRQVSMHCRFVGTANSAILIGHLGRHLVFKLGVFDLEYTPRGVFVRNI